MSFVVFSVDKPLWDLMELRLETFFFFFFLIFFCFDLSNSENRRNSIETGNVISSGQRVASSSYVKALFFFF